MRILVFGGTGGFGSTIAVELARDGHKVTAAGRNPRRGHAAAHRLGIAFTVLDRTRATPADLSAFDLVVDAAGPFQNQPQMLLQAAIEAGIDYVDISDARDFTSRIRALDHDARQAGVRVLSGASSTPALSTAVAHQLARDMSHVDAVDVAISASNKAAFGRSVLLSMLGDAGRSFIRGDGTEGRAMASPQRLRLEAAGMGALTRTLLEVETPDQDTITALLPGHPAVRFRAGGELAIHNQAMQLIATAVRAGVLRDGRSLLGVAGLARRLTSWIGSGRSAMRVVVTGEIDGVAVRRAWTLLADRNMGPLIPSMAVPAIVDAIDRRHVPPGARAAVGIVDAEEILSRMPAASVSIDETEEEVEPLYRRTMPGFARLAPALQAMHTVTSHHVARGVASVERGTSPLARLIAWTFRFPPAGRHVPVSVEFERHGNEELWTRDFGGRRFASRLTPALGGAAERFGPLSFRFRLVERDGSLAMEPVSWRAFGIPMPRALMPDGIATEVERDGVFTFDVPIRVPLAGLVVHYRGWLNSHPSGGEPPAPTRGFHTVPGRQRGEDPRIGSSPLPHWTIHDHLAHPSSARLDDALRR